MEMEMASQGRRARGRSGGGEMLSRCCRRFTACARACLYSTKDWVDNSAVPHPRCRSFVCCCCCCTCVPLCVLHTPQLQIQGLKYTQQQQPSVCTYVVIKEGTRIYVRSFSEEEEKEKRRSPDAAAGGLSYSVAGELQYTARSPVLA